MMNAMLMRVIATTSRGSSCKNSASSSILVLRRAIGRHNFSFDSSSSISLSSTSTGSSKMETETTSSITSTAIGTATATSEAEQLFRYYNKDSNKRRRQQQNETTKLPIVWKCRTEAATYIRENIDTVLFDCDGVLYRTSSLCPGASECIQGLLDNNKKVLFVTNNAGVNRRELREKLSTLLQIDSLTIDQMISSSYSSAQYLKQQLIDFNGGVDDNDNDNSHSREKFSPLNIDTNKSPRRVHVIGSSGLCEELISAGFDVTTCGSTNNNVGNNNNNNNSEPGSMSREELADYDFNKYHPIDALVVGHDTDMNFRKLCIADNLLLRNPDALFVATNKDSFDVVDGNEHDRRHIAGNGCTVVALEYSSKKKSINVGKPSKELFELIRRKDYDRDDNDTIEHNDNRIKEKKSCFDDPSRCLFVGDRLDTDIRFGNDNGMKSLLVMTGVTTAETMENLGNGTEEEPLPDFIVPYVGMLYAKLEGNN